MLTFDYLRADNELLFVGFMGCIAIAGLRASLPKANDVQQRNKAMALSLLVIILGVYRFVTMPYSLFNTWINAWMIVPGTISIIWLSSQAVSVWATRELSISAVEYGLKRNYNLQKQHKKIGSHTTLLHFVVLTLIPIIWIFFFKKNSVADDPIKPVDPVIIYILIN